MTVSSQVSRVLVAPIRAYQRWISPARPPSCRFEPTCSGYAVEALTLRGPVVGTVLAGWRLLRCAPWSKGGYDPVPTSRRTLREPRPAVSGTSRSLRREPSVVS